MRRKHLSLIMALLLLAALVAGLGWLVYAPIRQDRLNRALIAAIKQNDTKQALALLAEGADPNSRDEPPQHLSFWRLLLDRLRGKRPAPTKALTALLVALSPYEEHQGWEYPPDHPQLIQALLEKGANPNVSLGHGYTPLLLAVMAGDYAEDGRRRDDTIKLLVDHEADVNPPSMMSPLLIAVMGWSSSDDVIVFLLHRGAKIDAQDLTGQTPLMMAVRSRKVHVVALLLSYHANPNIAMGGMTPLSFAKRYASILQEKQIIQMLQQAGAKK